MRRLLDILQSELTAYQMGQVPDFDLMLNILDYTLNYPDLYHHPKEDRIYAKLLLRAPEAATLIGNLHREHEQLGELTRKFAAAVRGVLRDAELPRTWFETTARNYISQNLQHIAKEEEIFFPMALRILTPQDWCDLDHALASGRDPVLGAATSKDFERLRERILKLAV